MKINENPAFFHYDHVEYYDQVLAQIEYDDQVLAHWIWSSATIYSDS